MVKARRLPIGLFVPVLLVGLVALLGTLQYRWLGKVSEAEREVLRRSLDTRAREFVDEFDAEISRAFLALHLSQPEVAGGEWERFATAVERWRNAARFPRLVRDIYLLESSATAWTFRRYDATARAFRPAAPEWPGRLERLRPHLPALPRGAGGRVQRDAPDGQPQVFSITITPVVPDVPALMVPVGAAPPLSGPEPPPARQGGDRGVRRQAVTARFWLEWPGAFVVADLDEDVLRRTVLPALVERHLPDGSDSYRVAILSVSGEPLFSRGVAPGASLDPARADSVTPFFDLRLDVLRTVDPGSVGAALRSRVAAPGATPGAGRGDVGGRMTVVLEHRQAPGDAPAGSLPRTRPSWRLVLQHPAGSLDAAVSQVRTRNLWLGSGILAVLLAGVALVVINGRRAGQLATRQMEFVTTVSHELRTPLAVIRSAAQNLSAGVVSEPGQARRYGDLIEDEGRRLTEMVEQILEYSRVHGDRPVRDPRPLDVAQLLAALRASCETLCAQSGVTLEVPPPPQGTPQILGDEAAVQRALHNLVANAVKHAGDGRWVGVSAGPVTARGRPHVQIAVSDRGPGIPASEIAHVFEPFYRGRAAIERQVHGNGLGLSLVKRVVEAHGGTVTVSSAAGEGSSFTLLLPAVPAGRAGEEVRA